ncbi:putative structural maintenance of chromosomes protein 5-like [Triplophysa rosa]|uniref:Structural maintenance of chromosomes protein 5-like n=1 Tax=Triplophysa rosa TaxID=992332 RepID=A0A9W7WNV9_TRIRA|nr:putative structural maintenance of chromosomes protein 5-like [Triplophysa rosa]
MSHPTHFGSKPDAEQFCRDGRFECPCCSFTCYEKFSFTLHMDNHTSHAVEHGAHLHYACFLEGHGRSSKLSMHCIWPWTGLLTSVRRTSLSMSPASVSESTTTKESPPRHPVVCQQEDNDEVCEKNVKCRFVQDIGPAWSWVQTHRAFFRGEVMEPAYLQMDYENQQRLLEEYLRGDLEARDAFLFEFECAEDLDTFISNCNEKQGLKVHAMIKE